MKAFLALLLLSGTVFPANMHNLKTGSMPCFQGDDWLEMRDTPFPSLKVGDVICYRPTETKLAALGEYIGLSPLAAGMHSVFLGNGNKVCHRIVYSDAYSVVVKADISMSPDPFRIDSGDYYGQVMNAKCKNKKED